MVVGVVGVVVGVVVVVVGGNKLLCWGEGKMGVDWPWRSPETEKKIDI